MKKRNTALEAKMKAEGWVRPDWVAKQFSVSEAMIRGWAAKDEETGRSKVRARRVPSGDLGTLFVAWRDCVLLFGVDNAVTIGALKPEEAAKLRATGT